MGCNLSRSTNIDERSRTTIRGISLWDNNEDEKAIQAIPNSYLLLADGRRRRFSSSLSSPVTIISPLEMRRFIKEMQERRSDHTSSSRRANQIGRHGIHQRYRRSSTGSITSTSTSSVIVEEEEDVSTSSADEYTNDSCSRRREVHRLPSVRMTEETYQQNKCCSICFEDLKTCKKIDKAVRLPCGHVFHRKCVNQWLQKKDTCPICRNEYKHSSCQGKKTL